MKNSIYILGFLFILFSCKNNDNATETDPDASPGTEYTTESNTRTNSSETPAPGSTSEKEISADSPDQSEEESTGSAQSTTTLAGQYIKTGEEADISCKCYCLDINFSSNSELCLSSDKININVKYETAENDMINVYFVGPAETNSEGKDFPWEDFDKNSPIATIATQPNGEIELDWLGFSIDGDLAMDYAIFGKKTLEGSYKKK